MGCANSNEATPATKTPNVSNAPKVPNGVRVLGAASRAIEDLPRKRVQDDCIEHARFTVDYRLPIKECYSLGNELCAGSFGTVYKGVHLKTGHVHAVKAVVKDKMKVRDVRREIAVGKMIDHPNVVKLYATFEDAKTVYLVMEMCHGGELLTKIEDADEGAFSERECAHVVQQFLRAIVYMHSIHLIHRDFKPDNLLLMDDAPFLETVVKVIDFGTSCTCRPGQTLKTRLGTAYYMSPQVIAGCYDNKADVWSAGTIVYLMMCGNVPFNGDSIEGILKAVKEGNVKFDGDVWAKVSGDAKDLIRMMLTVDPKSRCLASDAMNHKWLKQNISETNPALLNKSVVDNLRHFNEGSRLKKAALYAIANRMSERDISSLRDIFLALDTNADGVLSTAEIEAGVEQAGFSDLINELVQSAKDADVDGSGYLDYNEFIAACLDLKPILDEKIGQTAFGVFDQDCDGVISAQELVDVLGEGSKDCITQFDSQGNGSINFNDFMAMLTSSPCGADDQQPELAALHV